MLAIYPGFRLPLGSGLRRTASMIECALNSSETQTTFGPLCAFGHYLTNEGCLSLSLASRSPRRA